MRKLIAKYLAGSLPPIRQNADTRLQVKINSINDHAIRAGACDAQEITFLHRLSERRGETQCNVSDFSMNQLFRCTWNVPWQIEFFGEYVCGAAGQQGQRDAVAVLLRGQPVHHFIERPIAAASD